ncbi:MAG: DNA repair protein RecN [Chitinophagales bacterium]|jgi:DNA repair protein RecN (Recombination protein N)|nr:DNA repair protein RecN [Chitinophagales bacterium]
MLLSLEIKNYAIIDYVKVEFDRGLNIITGETGAGKSLLLSSLGLIKGDRANTQLLSNPDELCFVEVELDFSQGVVKDFFEKNELVYEDRTIIRREITPNGKSRAFINDSPVSLQILQELSYFIIDIHSQHDALELKSKDFQLKILDAYAENMDLLHEFESKYQAFITQKKIYQERLENKEKFAQEKELLTYHVQEMNEYEFELWDFSKMESDLNLMEQSVELTQDLAFINQISLESEINIEDMLLQMNQKLQKYASIHPDIDTQSQRLIAMIEEFRDWSKTNQNLAEDILFDPNLKISLEEKINWLNKLMSKHQIADFEQLVLHKETLNQRLHAMQASGEDVEAMRDKLKVQYVALIALANTLSSRRKAHIEGIQDQVMAILAELGMENAVFQIHIQTSNDLLGPTGIDEVRFLFSANRGKEPIELQRAISGGEMSRFMLALKSIISQKMQLSTLVFDEIDTGVSGQVAEKVAKRLQKLAENHQIIAITHLPQIASKGDRHFRIYKEIQHQKTVSQFMLLDLEEKIIEIAKMISGDEITEISKQQARSLIS